MAKHILAQYHDLQEEAKDLRRRIKKLEEEIAKIKNEGTVKDTVTRGKKGKKPLGRVTIEGVPYPEYSRKKTRLFLYKAQLESAEMELLEIASETEKYIQSIEDSRIRRIIRLRYIDNLTWTQVAHKIGGMATADSVRMEHNRYLKQ